MHNQVKIKTFKNQQFVSREITILNEWSSKLPESQLNGQDILSSYSNSRKITFLDSFYFGF